MNLPEDIRQHVRNYIRKKVIAFVVLALVLSALLFLGYRTTKRIITPLSEIIGYVVAVLFSAFVTGVPLKLIDKTYYGTIEKLRIKSFKDIDKQLGYGGGIWFHNNKAIMKVQTGDGKRKTVRVFSGMGSGMRPLQGFQVGEKIFHLYGTKVTILLPTQKSEHVQCAVCGFRNKIEDKTCVHCDHTLIDTGMVDPTFRRESNYMEDWLKRN